jgi:ribonucleoside-diphosphate reductase alpha subunit
MYTDIEHIKSLVTHLCNTAPKSHNYSITKISNKILLGTTPTMNLNDFYTLFINVCDDMSGLELEYSKLGAWGLYTQTLNKKYSIHSIETFVEQLIYIDSELPNFMNSEFINFVKTYSKELNELVSSVNPLPEYLDLFGYKTLLGSYLIKINDQTIESPADMFARVAIAIHFRTPDLDIDTIFSRIKSTFESMYKGLYIHATPTLYNSGTVFEQMSSCYLLGTDDSLEGIFKTFTDAGKISKWSGGIGIHISNIRASGSRIAKTNGESSGIIPMLRCYNEIACYINQGGRGKKRPGAIAVYIEPWHADICEFLELKLNTGDEKLRTRDLFLALWVPDLFMKQLEVDGDWYLMCPAECPGLPDVYGDEFETLYWSYVNSNKFKEKIKATELLVKITKSLGESGVHYILFKDHINRKSIQMNIGTIKSSNLCAEICEVSDASTYAVCNLASIAVNRFVNPNKPFGYDFDALSKTAYDLTINLNNIINWNFYPTPETSKSNLSTRPIGIGIQGVADLLLELRIPYETDEACELESKVMESIYWGALNASCDLAKKFGPYNFFAGSPFSEGMFQFDLGYTLSRELMYPWDELRERVVTTGTRNSLLTSLMPTASTSQILGNMECFEPITSNIYSRKTSVGVFKVINRHLVKDLESLNLWNESMKNQIILSNGSIQSIKEIPETIKPLYKTVWEIKQKWIVDHALARQPFVDQSQSMNLYFEKIDISKVKNSIFYGWKREIKTGCYYMKSEAASDTAKVVSVTTTSSNQEKVVEDSGCAMCSA